MIDNTRDVQGFLDHVANVLIAAERPAASITFTVPCRLAHSVMPFDRPYIAIHFSGPNRPVEFFAGDNATECMSECAEWIATYQKRVA